MPNELWTHDEETRLAEYLVTRVSDRASGRSESECLRNYPRDVYFIGNLRPRSDDVTTQPGQFRELMNKLAPVAFGAEFLVNVATDQTQLRISLSWACYYRVFPTLDQQRTHQQRSATESHPSATPPAPVLAVTGNTQEQLSQEDDASGGPENEERQAESDSPEIAQSANDRRQRRTPQDSLSIRFRKILCQASGVVSIRRNEGRWTADISDLQSAAEDEIERARQLAISDSDRVRSGGGPDDPIRVPETALISQDAYQSFLNNLMTEVVPNWRWEIRPDIWSIDLIDVTQNVVAFEFVNTSNVAENARNIEGFFFDTKAEFSFEPGVVRAFELDLAPRSFRFDRHVWGRGINCAVERDGESSFVTSHTPIYAQMRYATRTTPRARFVELAENPIPVLDNILNALQTYRQVWQDARDHYILNQPDWESRFGPEFERDRQCFDEEINRFRSGCDLIRNNDDVRFAFQLTNETFRRGSKNEWRLFQIVFLVSQLPGIAALAEESNGSVSERERVDIIYFPTGGGKTEAYLATIVFHCFFDRLRGKTAGVTTWTRFPLRLLTLQQTQRVADVIGTADVLRREQSDLRLSGANVDGFAVGYFVGQGGSPNEIDDPGRLTRANADIQVVWSRVNDDGERQKWKRLARCPNCQTATVRIDFEPGNARLVHRCTNPQCAFPNGEIPVYIVDNEIYRYLPCVIVGTIDKLAGIGNQRKFSLILGQVDGRCSLHGYYKGKCCQSDCTDRSRLRPTRPPGLSGPTLFVQDELHLLKEGLGTFDGHYETFTQTLVRELGQLQPLKIIASSATIEAFERQVQHLYGRGPGLAHRFPGDGPLPGQSFYAETLSFPQRLYVGIIPHNKTIFNSILELIELYHREIQSLQRLGSNDVNPYGGSVEPNTSAWERLVDLWQTSLSYFLANRELNSIRTDLEGDVIPHLQRDGLLPIAVSELTGSTSTDDVSRILERLEQPAAANIEPDAVLATSMVSHGVDIDRLNTMIFYGMPRQNAEYIQASSRVGRAHVGLVFACLHPVRERDQSHYAYFNKFHEFLGQLVEPVAINRWSKFSIDRTLPGLFMGVLLQLIANQSGESNPNRFYMLDFVRRKISDGSLRAEHFIPLLERAYQVDVPVGAGEIAFKEEIQIRVRQYLDWIVSGGSGKTFVSEVLIPQPMRSLRDVDEAINIELDTSGSQWTSRMTGN